MLWGICAYVAGVHMRDSEGEVKNYIARCRGHMLRVRGTIAQLRLQNKSQQHVR